MMSDSRSTANPPGVFLEKMYKFGEQDDNKVAQWAPRLRELLKERIPFNVEVSSVRDEVIKEIVTERFYNYIYSRLVVGGCYALLTIGKLLLEDADEEIDDQLKEVVDGVLDVGDETKTGIVWFLARICPRIIGGKADPTPKQKRSIRRFAIEHNHRCYMCGRSLHYDGRPFGDDDEKNIAAIREKRAFNVEHIWSQARGGSRSPQNLAASCRECNNLKKHLMSFVDAPVEQIITIATDTSSVQADMPGNFKLPLFWRQDGRCGVCEKKLHDMDSEAIYLVRRELDQPYHFLNMMIVCERCNEQQQLNGVSLRA